MYVILRHKGGDKKDEVCFVQAGTVEKAKEMVGVPQDSIEWGVVSNDLLTDFADLKEGYFVKSF